MASTSSPSPLRALAVVLCGMGSIASSVCGGGDSFVVDAGPTTHAEPPDEPPDEPQGSVHRSGDGTFVVEGVGDVAVVTVQATLSQRCLSESPDYFWGYPTGWASLWHRLRTDATTTADTGLPSDTAADEVVVRVVISDATGAILAEADTVASPTGDDRDLVRVGRPFIACERDVVCAVAWTYTLTLLSGAEAHGEIGAWVSLDQCSVGDPVEGDLTVTVF